MPTERIDIVVTERGAREVNRSINQIGASAAGAAPGVTRLQGAVGGLIASIVSLTALVAGGGAILGYANTFVALQNRIRTTTDSVAGLTVVTNELFEVANRTRASVESTVELYVRASLATRDLGRSQQETINFTESLNQAVILSGVSAQEATAGIIQLSQGLASGTLRGDELRSVLEQLPAVADVIAEHMGITRGELRRMGFEGKITAEIVLDAFKAAADELDERFANSVLTVDQSLTVLRNTSIQFFGELDRGLGVTRALSDLVKFLSDNIEVLARVALAALITGFTVLATVVIPLLIRQVGALFAMIAAHPIGALLVALTAGASALIAFSDEIVVFQEHTVTLQDVAVATFEIIGEEVVATASRIGEALETTWRMAVSAFSGVEEAGTAAAEGTRRSWFQNLLLIAEAFDRLVNGFVQVHFALMARLSGQTEEQARQTAITIQTALFGGIVDVSGAIERIQQRATDRARERAAESARSQAELDEAMRRLQEAGERRVAAPAADEGFDRAEFLDRVNREIKQSTTLLRLNSREREVQAQLMEISNTLIDNVADALSGPERTGLQKSIRLLQERSRVMQEMDAITDELTGKQEALITRIQLLEQLVARGGPGLGQFTRLLREANLEMLELRIQSGEGGFADAFILGLARMSEAAVNWRATVGFEFSNFFESFADGAANAFARAIVYGEDLGDALMNVARSAVAELIAALIKLGIQWVINATIGTAVAEASAAASVAMAATVAAAWSAAATAVTLASYGANVPVAIAGMASAYAAGAAFAAVAAVPGFRDGGLFLGPGGPRQDAGLARVSRGEFIVNADSTRRNMALLRAINDNSSGALAAPRSGDVYVTNHTTINVSDTDPRRAEEAGRAAAREFERGVEQVIRKHKRPGGLIVRGHGGAIAG